MTVLRPLLSFATALAILQAVVKIAELCLDSRQQTAFQGAVDKLTLRLIDLNPIRHYSRLSSRRVQIYWLGLTTLMIWATSILTVGWHPILTHAWLAAYFFGIPVLLYFPFRITVSWLARSTSPGRMLLKVLAFVGVGGTAWALLWIELYDDSAPPLAISLPFYMLEATFFYAGVIVVLIYAAQAAVWLFMQSFWRIATYAKGAWSAVVIIVAAFLAVLSALVSRS